MNRTLRWVAMMSVAALVSVGAVHPAAGAPPPEPFNELFQSFPITVNGSYTPLLGRLDCALGAGDAAVIWYAPGSSADWIWKDISFSLEDPDGVEHTSGPLSVNGTFEPFVGDFDGDGCDDVFWYAPGSGADYVWYGVVGGGFSSKAVTVNGDYTPLVGDWDGGTPGDDIFWYGSGGGTESIWGGTPLRGTFAVSSAPQVMGTDFMASSNGGGVLFYRPGTGADYVWEDILAGATAPGLVFPVAINGTYQPHHIDFGFLLYGRGPAADRLAYGWNEDGSVESVGGTINGTYRLGVAPPNGFFGLLLFHGPGPAQDYLWARAI